MWLGTTNPWRRKTINLHFVSISRSHALEEPRARVCCRIAFFNNGLWINTTLPSKSIKIFLKFGLIFLQITYVRSNPCGTPFVIAFLSLKTPFITNVCIVRLDKHFFL